MRRLVISLALLVGCASEATSPSVAPSTAASIRPSGCDPLSAPAPVEGPSVALEPVGEVDGIRVEAAVYPHPDYEAELWSQWGQGVVLPDGRFVSAIGDHLGADGNSYIYEYDPSTSELTQTSDVLSVVEHQDGEWGYGKIHAQMQLDPCGRVYLTTYWGDSSGIEYRGGYTGDLLLEYDPATHGLNSLGVPVPEHGVPSLAGWFPGGLLYGEAANPEAGNEEGSQTGSFFAYDLAAGAVAFEDDGPHTGFRSLAVDGEGRAYVSTGDGGVARFDPANRELSPVDSTLPGNWIRASTVPGPDGTVYGVTKKPPALFALRPDGTIDELGDALDYTASMALDPSGSRFFYVPGAHGKGIELGTPLMAVDTATGDQQELVRLNDLIEEALGVQVGGSYNVAVSDDGRTVYVGLNGGEPGSEELFGIVVLAVVHLP